MKTRVYLAPLYKEDFSKVIDWQIDADFLYQWAGAGYHFPLTIDQYIQRLSEGVNRQWADEYVYKIMLKETETIIGTVELAKIDRDKKVATISRFLIGDPAYRGLGFGSEVMGLLEHIAKEQLGLSRLFLKVFTNNTGALTCYENNGYLEVRLEKNVYRSSEGLWDVVVMSKELE